MVKAQAASAAFTAASTSALVAVSKRPSSQSLSMGERTSNQSLPSARPPPAADGP
jgi:hypothetical protein